MKNMKKALIMAIGGAALMGAAGAQAASVSQVGSNPFTFVGSTVLNQTGLPSITCTLTLTGNVTAGGGAVTVDVTSGSVSGGFGCSAVDLEFPWTATTTTAAAAGEDTPVTFDGVIVSTNLLGSKTYCGSSSGNSVDAVFNNGSVALNAAASQFSFNTSIGSNCTVNGTLTGQNFPAQDVDLLP
ncbi:hypothetical protein RYH70_11885 [Alloalcanivorax xenomutans]|uniref:hypothetical protein n=1 Tax=Alloalcanivorax xenomutans TaxID=1094342 RepID=UPI00293509CC|nr:hypothetical protein [Alloalcanivorax xenomutans]WOD26718.1 hypothetical protein RYH70_11885 [Alloalcanivorax xenomutans]